MCVAFDGHASCIRFIYYLFQTQTWNMSLLFFFFHCSKSLSDSVLRVADLKELGYGWITATWWQSATVFTLMWSSDSSCTSPESPLKVKWRGCQVDIQLKTYLVAYLTSVALLCLQAWDPAESPRECTSSPATPSASPWASRAPGAGGGDPGLRRWGARGPRRLLQRSEGATHAKNHSTLPITSATTSVAPASNVPLIASDCSRPPSVLPRAALSLKPLKRHAWCLCLQGFKVVRWLPERRDSQVPCSGSGCQKLHCALRLIFIPQLCIKMLHPFCRLCRLSHSQLSLNTCGTMQCNLYIVFVFFCCIICIFLYTNYDLHTICFLCCFNLLLPILHVKYTSDKSNPGKQGFSLTSCWCHCGNNKDDFDLSFR